MTRTATIGRTTRETTITVTVNLDGDGSTSVATGIGMFDHLLTSFGHHSLIDLTIAMTGDLEVDDHHTVEDTMLAFGEAIDDALGDRTGIVRYGDARIPMDEAIAGCALDLGGRSYAVVGASFRSDRIGALSTQMIEHALEAFSRTLRATIHLDAAGRNDHHIAEAMFKALARAMREAVSFDDRRSGVASTKGVL